MQYLNIDDSTTLGDITQAVGTRNVDTVLSTNGLTRSPNIGKQFNKKCEQIISEATGPVSPQRKIALLNTLTSDSEAYEKACLMSENEWQIFSSLNTFESALKIPETIQMAPSANILGTNQSVSKRIYQQTMMDLKLTGEIDPVIFSNYSTTLGKAQDGLGNTASSTNLFEAFKLPWGDIQLYSSLADESVDFPVYPEELEYSRVANYTTMNETLFQYEPWYIYESSGPREQTFTFHFHRDMWSGDHRDGKANDLVRFCEANCYPEYDGAAVNTSTVTLYIKGAAHITGIVTNVTPKWSGPIGLDGWYLECDLSLTIAEVAKSPLSFSTIRKMNVIGGYNE